MKSMRIGILSAAAMAAAVLSGCGWWNGTPAGEIQLYGNIELTQVDMAFKIPGKLIERTVDEGDEVRKGMTLGRLQTDQLQRELERDRAALAAARSQLPQLETSILHLKATLAAETELRRAQLDQAQARLDELLAGSREQEIRESKAAVEQARTQHLKAQLDWERAQALYKKDDISTSQYDQYRTNFDATAAALKQAEEKAALVVAGPRRETIDAARAQVGQAKANLKLTEAGNLELKRLEQELETRRAQVDEARAQVKVVEAQIDDAVVTSPVNGVVLVKSAEVGEVLAAGTTFLTIGEMDRPWVRAYINESDLGRVKHNSRVEVKTDSYPGKIYHGRVSFISSEAEFTPKQIQTPEERVKLVYRIKIEIENPRHELKLNMPVEARLLLDQSAGSANES